VELFPPPEQFSDISESHEANKQWLHGDFSFAAAGEGLPKGSWAFSLKVPWGLKFLPFPRYLL
jgi:hypothetical protein